MRMSSGRLFVAALILFHGCSSESDSSGDKTGVIGSGGNDPVDAGLDQGSPDSAGGGGYCPFKEYHSPGCGVDAPNPICGSGISGACGGEFCACTGQTIIGCWYTSAPYAYEGPCEAGTPLDAEVSDGDACVWLYDLPGCGAAAPPPICTEGKDDACTLPFCGCDGVTFQGGCGKSAQPFAAYGPCETDASN